MTMPTARPAPAALARRLAPLALAIVALAGAGHGAAAATALGRCQTDSEKGFHEVAIPACDRLIEASGTRPSLKALALYYRANSLFSTGRDEAAQADIEASLDITPGNGAAQALKGSILARGGRSRAAVEALTRAVELGFGDPQVLRLRGSLLLELGEADKAMSDLRQVVLDAPRDAVALTQLALAEERTGRGVAAFQTASRAIEANPDYAPAYGVRAAIRSDAGDAQGALKDYDEAAARDKDNAGYRVGRAGLLLRAGQLDDALAEVDAALAAQPKLDVALTLKADILDARGDYAQELATLKQRAAGNPAGLLWQARIALKLERFAEAAQTYDAALKDADALPAAQIPVAHFERGQARQRLGEPKAAAEDYSAALAGDASLAEKGVQFLRGKARYATGDLEGALADFQAEAARQPEAAPPLVWQALSLAGLGDFAAAETAARKVVGLEPDSARAEALLGDVLLKAGNLEAGRAAHEKALQIDPGYAPSRARLDELKATN